MSTAAETKNSDDTIRYAMLTTVDNPFDPFRYFDLWYATDLQLAVANGRRDCCSLLAIFTKNSPKFSDSFNEKLNEQAIDEIVLNDPLKIYKKVVKVGNEN